MRHAPPSGDLRNIRPQNYRKKGTNSWTRSWQVHFTFKGRKPVSESFNWNRYGGEEASRMMAIRFRDAMENEFAASEIGYGKFGDVDLIQSTGSFALRVRRCDQKVFASTLIGLPTGQGFKQRSSLKSFPLKSVAGRRLQRPQRSRHEKPAWRIISIISGAALFPA